MSDGPVVRRVTAMPAEGAVRRLMSRSIGSRRKPAPAAPEKGSQSTMGTSPPETLHPGAPSESQAVYRSQVTLGLSGWRPVPRFARLTALLVGVFQKTPGAVKLTFSVAPGRRQFTSHSVWRDSAAAQEFFKSVEGLDS